MNEYQNQQMPQNSNTQPPIGFNQVPNINMNMYGFLEQMKKKYHFTALFALSIVEIVLIPLFGILSLVFTNIMKDAFIVGDFMKADKYAKYSKIMLIIGGALFVISIILIIVLYVVLFSMMFRLIENNYMYY